MQLKSVEYEPAYGSPWPRYGEVWGDAGRCGEICACVQLPVAARGVQEVRREAVEHLAVVRDDDHSAVAHLRQDKPLEPLGA